MPIVTKGKGMMKWLVILLCTLGIGGYAFSADIPLRLDELLAYVKDSVVPYAGKEDVVDYVEVMLAPRALALGKAGFILAYYDEIPSDMVSFIQAVSSDACGGLTNREFRSLCDALTGNDLEKFMSFSYLIEDELMEDRVATEEDLKLFFYLYQYYKSGVEGLLPYTERDLLAVYILQFLTLDYCGCKAKEYMEKAFRLLGKVLSGRGKAKELSGLSYFYSAVTTFGYRDYLEFKKRYF